MKKELYCVLIDDDADDHEFFSTAISSLNIPVRLGTALSGEEGLSLLNSSDRLPDLLFLDLNMPGMNGRECLSAMKRHDRLQHIKVVVYSTSSFARDRSVAEELGAVDYLVKPSSIRTLVSSISNLIEKHLS